MRGPHWVERPDLSAEVNDIMGQYDFSVYEDMPHGCFHVVRGYDDEFTSVPMPWGEGAREVLRRQGWIMHNNASQQELDYYKEQHEKLQRNGDKEENDVCRDMAKSLADYADGHIMFTPK
jgi:hypothetical protein